MKKLMSLVTWVMAAVLAIGCGANVERLSDETVGTSRQALETDSESGSYVGNGTSQTITLAANAAMVFVVSGDTGATAADRGGAMAIDSMPAGAGWTWSDATVKYAYIASGGVTFGTNDFTVGSNTKVNKSGETFYWYAIHAGSWIKTGTYVGTTKDGFIGFQTINLGVDCTNALAFAVRGDTDAADGSAAISLPDHDNNLAMAFEQAAAGGKNHTSMTDVVSSIYGVSAGLYVRNGGPGALGFTSNMNVKDTTYYYAVMPSLTGFGTSGVVNATADGVEETVNLGENVRFLLLNHRYNPGGALGTYDPWFQISFDPMPAQASLYLDRSQSQFKSGAAESPTRQATGFLTGNRLDTSTSRVYYVTLR